MPKAKTKEPEFNPIALETLTGDLRDAILTNMRSMETPWSLLSEAKQQDKIDAAVKMAEDLVRRATELIAAKGFDHVLVKIGKMVIAEKGFVQSSIECAKSEENVVHLMARQNAHAILILGDPADYFGEREAAKPDPDQPELKEAAE